MARILLSMIVSAGATIFWLNIAFHFLPFVVAAMAMVAAGIAYYVGGRLRLLVPRQGLFGGVVHRIAESIQFGAMLLGALNMTLAVAPSWLTRTCLVIVAVSFMVMMASSPRPSGVR